MKLPFIPMSTKQFRVWASLSPKFLLFNLNVSIQKRFCHKYSPTAHSTLQFPVKLTTLCERAKFLISTQPSSRCSTNLAVACVLVLSKDNERACDALGMKSFGGLIHRALLETRTKLDVAHALCGEYSNQSVAHRKSNLTEQNNHLIDEFCALLREAQLWLPSVLLSLANGVYQDKNVMPLSDVGLFNRLQSRDLLELIYSVVHESSVLAARCQTRVPMAFLVLPYVFASMSSQQTPTSSDAICNPFLLTVPFLTSFLRPESEVFRKNSGEFNLNVLRSLCTMSRLFRSASEPLLLETQRSTLLTVSLILFTIDLIRWQFAASIAAILSSVILNSKNDVSSLRLRFTSCTVNMPRIEEHSAENQQGEDKSASCSASTRDSLMDHARLYLQCLCVASEAEEAMAAHVTLIHKLFILVWKQEVKNRGSVSVCSTVQLESLSKVDVCAGSGRYLLTQCLAEANRQVYETDLYVSCHAMYMRRAKETQLEQRVEEVDGDSYFATLLPNLVLGPEHSNVDPGPSILDAFFSQNADKSFSNSGLLNLFHDFVCLLPQLYLRTAQYTPALYHGHSALMEKILKCVGQEPSSLGLLVPDPAITFYSTIYCRKENIKATSRISDAETHLDSSLPLCWRRRLTHIMSPNVLLSCLRWDRTRMCLMNEVKNLKGVSFLECFYRGIDKPVDESLALMRVVGMCCSQYHVRPMLLMEDQHSASDVERAQMREMTACAKCTSGYAALIPLRRRHNLLTGVRPGSQGTTNSAAVLFCLQRILFLLQGQAVARSQNNLSPEMSVILLKGALSVGVQDKTVLSALARCFITAFYREHHSQHFGSLHACCLTYAAIREKLITILPGFTLPPPPRTFHE